jgi:arthrofactin-type cyclic lipopeptide synthetase C
MLQAFLEHEQAPACVGLRQVISSGEALPAALVRRFHERLARAQLHNLYGPTEAAVDVTAWRCSAADDNGSGTIPIGRPIANTRIYILDGHGGPVPVGVAGNIHIGGVQVGRGYLNRPELTAERFVADPFTQEPGARMYCTGDLGRWLPEGSIEYLGRNDFQIKIRGFRIELGEIEARLSECAGVRHATVMAREDTPGDKRLVAYYTGEAELSAQELRRHLSASLPEYMVPAGYVKLEALPLTPNGKLDRKALPAPDGDVYVGRSYEAPQGEVEQKLAAIWSELLKIEQVGRRDNFFELGGHSLLAVKLASTLKRDGINVSLSQIFAYPNIQALARECLSSEADQMAIVSLRAEGNELPLFLVHEVSGEVLSWAGALTRHLDKRIPVYGLVAQAPTQLAFRTMQGMAARLIRAIRTVQPKGPYRIAGWSFGGILAYEIATQLIGDDDEVQFVGLLESWNDAPGKEEMAKNSLLDGSILYGLISLWQDIPPESLQELNAIDSTNLDGLWRKYLELSLVPEGYNSLSMEELRPYLARARMYIQAMHAYQPQAMGIPVHLFAAQDNGSGDPTLGWSKVLPLEHLSLISVPGNHISIIREPNVAILGAELSRCICNKNQEVAPKRAPADALLIPIRTASRAQGAIFCIPGAGGNAASFASLADALGDDWKLYGFQPRGLNGVDIPYSTVEAAARAYLQSLEELHPAEPIHLLGHSFGGWVMLEMALRLQAAGRFPSSLTVVDSEIPHDESNYHHEYTNIDVLMKLVEIWEMTADCSMGIDSKMLEPLSPKDQLSLLHEHAIRVGLVPRRTRSDMLVGTIRTLAAALRTYYHPETTCTQPVNLILLADSKLDSQAQEHQFIQTAAGWRRWAPTLEVWRGPGNHMTALKPPDVQVLANWLLAKIT